MNMGENWMRETHPMAGRTVRLREGIGLFFLNGEVAGGKDFIVEDWVQNVFGCSVWEANGNPAAMEYAMRTGTNGNNTPMDNEVVYGKVAGLGHIVHNSELEVTENDP